MNIDTLIFDLGGVVIDLDEHETYQALARLSPNYDDQLTQKCKQLPIVKDHEKGLISDQELRQGLKDFLQTDVEDKILDQAWNAMLGDAPLERLQFLKSLKNKFKVLVLSNTNAIHVTAFNKTVQQNSGESNLAPFTHELYFSHELHMRKPDKEIYEEVLSRSGSKADNCLFLDDKKENLIAAESVGIHTLLIKEPNEIFNIEQHIQK